MRLIDADALKRDVKRWFASTANRERMKEALDSAPTIEAEPVRHAKYDAAGDCTNCGFPIPTDDRIDAIFEEEIRYCYHCGSKMDGGADGQTG